MNIDFLLSLAYSDLPFVLSNFQPRHGAGFQGNSTDFFALTGTIYAYCFLPTRFLFDSNELGIP